MSPDRTYTGPALSRGLLDRSLTHHDRLALAVAWQILSPVEFKPMKPEALAFMLGIKRQSASRSLRRLVEAGYLHAIQPDPRAPREYLLVNVVTAPIARAA